MPDAQPLLYTEVDVVADRLSIDADSFDFTQYERNEEVYAYYDYGVDNFADFEHDFTIVFDDSSDAINGDSYPFAPWALANDLGIERNLAAASKTFLEIECSTNGTNNFIVLRERDGGTSYTDLHTRAVGFYTLYCTVVRVGTAYTLKIYSNEARTVLLDTLSLTLHTTTKFKYHYGFMGIGGASGGAWSSGEVKDISGTGFGDGIVILRRRMEGY